MLSRSGQIGRPLPDPYPVFGANRVRFRYGATTMIAGQPGSFKSVLALNMLIRWCRDHKLSAMYFSADSDEFTVAKRCAGILTGMPSEQVELEFRQRGQALLESLLVLKTTRFEYRTLDMEEISDRLHSFEQVYGAFPDVVFIDNLMNFVDVTGDWARMLQMTVDLDVLARETKSHVMVLHHASEGKVKAGEPVPRGAIQGMISQIPRLVLTTWATENALGVACVKNTNGPQFPNAERAMAFSVQPSLEIEEAV